MALSAKTPHSLEIGDKIPGSARALAGNKKTSRRTRYGKMPLNSHHKHRLRKSLLFWYQLRARDLPWRRKPSPYLVWISEVMLQQTPIRVALPYFLRFIKRFPDLRTLAEAPLDEVLQVWAGLGYYRRARMLHQASQQLVHKIPKTWEEWQKLPGVGRYTARAVSSIVFGERVAAIDANARRVLSRIFFQKSQPPHTFRELEALSEDVMGDAPPGLWNQAIMELGSLVCLPSKPKCEECPVARWCGFYQCGKPSSKLTVKSQKPSVKAVHICLCSLTREGIGLRRAERGEWWEGMYVFPRIMVPEGQHPESCLQDLRLRPVIPLATLSHSIMNYRITLCPFIVSRRLKGVQYFSLEDAPALPMPSPDRRVLRQILTRK